MSRDGHKQTRLFPKRTRRETRAWGIWKLHNKFCRRCTNGWKCKTRPVLWHEVVEAQKAMTQ